MYVFIFLAPLAEVVRVKSLYHLMLEKQLEENKNRVLLMVKKAERNESEIIRLRADAANITRELTKEILREMQVESLMSKLLMIMIAILNGEHFYRKTDIGHGVAAVCPIASHYSLDEDKSCIERW